MNPFHFLKQKKLNKPKGFIRQINTIDEIADFIIKENYSAGFYNPPQRSELHWKKTNILILDIDDIQPDSKSIIDISIQLNAYMHVIAPTKSHQIPKGLSGQINDRYRVLLFLDRYIYNLKEYKMLAMEICSKFDLKTDLRATDPTHFFYSSINIHSKNAEGLLINVDSYLKEPLFKNDVLSIPNFKKSDFKYHESDSLIPNSLTTWIFEINSKDIRIKRERFIRILMAQKDFVTYDQETGEIIGHGRNIIPQVFLSEYLNIEVKTLRRWLKYLIDQKQLECVGKYYGKNWKCKEYKALNDLEKAIIFAFYKNNNQPVDKFLPSTISDGEWEKELMKAAWYFVKNETPDNFYNWANSLPTLNDKRDRKLKVERAWKSVKKRIALLVYNK